MSYSTTPNDQQTNAAIWKILESRDLAILKLREQQHNDAQLKDELQQIQSVYQNLEERYHLAESDRADRLQVIEKQGQDLANLQALMHQTQTVMVQYREQLESALAQLDKVRSELHQTQDELQGTQSELYQTQGKLQNQQNQLAQTQTNLENSKNKISRQKANLKDLRARLEASQTELKTMQASKFWKLRNQWFKLKRLFN